MNAKSLNREISFLSDGIRSFIEKLGNRIVIAGFQTV